MIRKPKKKREEQEEHSSGYFHESTMDFSDRYLVREDFIFTRKTDLLLIDSLLHFNTMVANEAKDAMYVRNFDPSMQLRIRNLAASKRFLGLLRFQMKLLQSLCRLVIRVRKDEIIKDSPIKELMDYLLQSQEDDFKPIKRMGRSAVRIKFEKAMIRKYNDQLQEYKYYLEKTRDEIV